MADEEQTPQPQVIEFGPELIAELRVILGVEELEQKLEAAIQQNTALTNCVEQLLAYTNQVDLRIQQFNGEKVITQKFTPDISSGKLSLIGNMPDLPLGMTDPKGGMEEKVITSQRPKRKVGK